MSRDIDHVLYNENVMRHLSYIPDYDEYEELECDADIVDYDDSDEWYNIYGSEADGWVAGMPV